MAYGQNPGMNPGMNADDMAGDTTMDRGAAAITEGQEGTTTLPVSVTGGKTFKAGDEIVLEVVNVMDDGSLEVKYASEHGKEGEEEGKKEESYDDYIRREMSPREPREEAY